LVELQGLYTRGQTVPEKRFGADGHNTDSNTNVKIVLELDKELVKRLLVQGMLDTS
jgi:inosine-uridine nucleoside N-ribohydrolase